ncbi:pyrroline-5-carboxylate reductase [Altererythrobacter sp. ZODW24]|uniref:pyrroline-5-carboxylate reductase n=1 Tax=Altererythrobacter sp. ZODW24 TaxID=2185142 RepID=UPI000DF72FFD|nr:pyrroline-5-carboxylate reductase [Altererythrobacter sp. ZODW24]
MDNFDKTLLIAGCGNMGGAMLDGWLAAGMPPSQITVMDRSRPEKSDGVRLIRNLPHGERFDYILLGFKPHQLGDLAPELAKCLDADTAILSMLAGVQCGVLADTFPAADARIRVMPNLAVALGKSPIALAATDDLTPAARAEVDQLMVPLGTGEWIGEDEFDLVTALAGSGPAFVYRFIDALAAGAAELGLPREQADRLALAMVEGAASLAARSDHSPAALADRVASPGGVTRMGMDVMDDGGRMEELATDVLRAARDRSAQMAEEARKKG